MSSTAIRKFLLRRFYELPIAWLRQRCVTKQITLFLIWSCNTHFRTQQNYDRVYGHGRESGKRDVCESSDEEEVPVLAEAKELVIDVPKRRRDESAEICGAADKYPRDHELDWDDFPKYPYAILAFRTFTTFYMAYVVIKYLILDIYRDQLYEALKLPIPLHCFLPGRLIVSDRFSIFIGFLMCSIHLLWRVSVHLRRLPYKLSVVYFLMLHPNDMELLYSRMRTQLASKNSIMRSTYPGLRNCIELTLREAESLSRREVFILETMCFRIDKLTRVCYLLRPNRTMQAHLKLRKFLSNLVYFGIIVCALIGSWLFAYGMMHILLDRNYLRVYHQCDRTLQQLNNTGQLSEWSVTMTWPHVAAGLADAIENFVIWLEGGLVLVFGSSYACLLNYDLLMYWHLIDLRIRNLSKRAGHKLLKDSSGEEYQANPLHNPSIETQEAIVELQYEMMDFFGEVRQTDLFISDAIRVALIGALYFSASFTYFTQVKSLNLPPGVIVLVAFISACILSTCFSFLTLHRHCIRSYTPVCTLIAHDCSTRKRKFGPIMDMYLQRRTCYTLFQQYPFGATTFITIVSYWFSCFFLISGLLRQRQFQTCIQQHPRDYCSIIT